MLSTCLQTSTVSPDPAEYPVRSDAGMLRSSTHAAEMPDGFARPWPGPLIQRLPRLPGQKEARIAQLLGGPIDLDALAAAPVMSTSATTDAAGGSWRERVGSLETEVARLTDELSNLRSEFDRFREQF